MLLTLILSRSFGRDSTTPDGEKNRLYWEKQGGIKPEQLCHKLLQPIRSHRLKPRHVTALDTVAEVYQALVLGTRDYIHKNGFEKVVIGLSGGVDSAIVATIAVDALGKDNVIGISMPSRYSSTGSVTDTKSLVTESRHQITDHLH